MATITPGSVLTLGGGFNTSTPMSGTFIPTIWSTKLAQKFYAASTFADICNTDWQGDISDYGDKVIINTIPDITISNYTPGGGLSYQVPTPSTITLNIDKAKSFAFQTNDVLVKQSNLQLMDMFSNDAAMQMKVAIDSNCFYNTFSGGSASNKGATAGVKSGSYNLGTEAAPVTLSGSNIVGLLTSMAGVLDEYNIPESDRFLIVDPVTRQWLMQSNLAQAQFMGDSQSIVRNGKIGQIKHTVH